MSRPNPSKFASSAEVCRPFATVRLRALFRGTRSWRRPAGVCVVFELKDEACPVFTTYPGGCPAAQVLIEHGFGQRLANFNPLGLVASARWDVLDVRILPPHQGNVAQRGSDYCVK